MTTKLNVVKESVDVGIVTNDLDSALAFYRDLVGLPEIGQVAMDGFTVTRLQCGGSVVKLLSFEQPPTATTPSGGLGAATGLRYWTVSISGLDELLERCRAAGRPVIDGPTEVRPGVTIALVEDPDGNIVEFVNRG